MAGLALILMEASRVSVTMTSLENTALRPEIKVFSSLFSACLPATGAVSIGLDSPHVSP